MQRIVKKIVGKVVQVTTLDERWYGEFDKKDNYIGFRPSITWIGSYYPKGKYYEKWMAGHGYDESQILMREAGERGSRVHKAVEELAKRYMEGDKKGIKMDELFIDLEGNKNDLNPDEWYAVMTFVDWFKSEPTEILASEKTFLSAKFGCTLDLYYKRNKEYRITDVKTSQSIHPNSEIQLTGQKIASEDNGLKVDKVSILQIGYRLNKRGWKEKEYPFQPELLDAVYTIWKKENSRKRPHQLDYPLVLSLF